MADNTTEKKLTIILGDITGEQIIQQYRFSSTEETTLHEVASRLQEKEKLAASEMVWFDLDGNGLDPTTNVWTSVLATSWKGRPAKN